MSSGRLSVLFSLFAAVSLAVGACTAEEEFPTLEHETAGVFLQETVAAAAPLDGPRRGLTAEGLALLKVNEGEYRCRGADRRQLHCPYNDSARFCTIGHGHLIARAACEDIRPMLQSNDFLNGIGDARAEELLLADLRIAQSGVERHLTGEGGALGRVPLSDHQYDALISFVFNVGVPNFNQSTLLREIESREAISGDGDVAYQFRRWRRSGGVIVRGLVNRREREIAHFFTGYPTPQPAAALAVGDDSVDIRAGEP